MAGNQSTTALSPGQMLNHQRVRRIPRLDMMKIRIGTWNVRTMFEAGKLDNAVKEMDRMNVDIMGVSETRWPNNGTCRRSEGVFYYSGNDSREHRNGVGFIVKDRISRSVRNVVAYSDRIILMQIDAKPININLVQVYAPTADKPDAEADLFYQQIQEVLTAVKTSEITIVIGDFNAKVGRGAVPGIAGAFGLGERNERGDRLVELCNERGLVIKNTFYQLPYRRLYTWKSPGDGVRNQIDYILINSRFQNSIRRVSAYPGADIGSDHNPLVANFSFRCKIIRKECGKRKPDVGKLKDPQQREIMKNELARLCDENNPNEKEDPNDIWQDLKANLQEATRNVLTSVPKVNHKIWMTNEILNLMEQRRLAKPDPLRYRQLDRCIKAKIKEAKADWVKSECEEAENLHKLHDSFNFHRKLKQITGIGRNTPLTSLHNDEGKLVLEQGKLQDTWNTYATNLFRDNREEDPNFTLEELTGPSILESEVIRALDTLKNGKSPGHDDVYAEVFKQVNTKLLTNLFNKIYNTGRIPQDWLKSTFVPIPKKANPKKCEDYRLISLMSHALKAFLRIIHCRISRKCEEMSGETQFGFVRGLGTREALFCLKLLIQKCYDQRQNVYACFIDYQRAFDNVKHELLVARLGEIGIDEKDIRFIKNLYWNQTAEVRINNNLATEPFGVLKGVRQGCILSPLLFNIYVEKIFQLAMEGESTGIKINGRPLNNLRYADDTVVIASTVEELQNLIDRINVHGKRYGLNINISKTKVMRIGRQTAVPRILINGETIEEVSRFRYLGAIINNKWDCDEEIKTRVGMAKTTFWKLKNMLLQRDLPLDLRLRVVKCYVWPVLLYGAETWSVKVRSINRIEAFEMWTLRRLLRISWTEHTTNEEVLRRADTERQLMNIVKHRKMSYLGHILRGERYSIPKLILQGKIEGRRGPGRKQHSWLRNIRDWSGIADAATLFRQAEENTLILMR